MDPIASGHPACRISNLSPHYFGQPFLAWAGTLMRWLKITTIALTLSVSVSVSVCLSLCLSLITSELSQLMQFSESTGVQWSVNVSAAFLFLFSEKGNFNMPRHTRGKCKHAWCTSDRVSWICSGRKRRYQQQYQLPPSLFALPPSFSLAVYVLFWFRVAHKI